MQVVADGFVACLDCAHYRIRDAGALGGLGFGLCAKSRSRALHTSAVYRRKCSIFVEAEDAVRASRAAWNEKRRGKRL